MRVAGNREFFRAEVALIVATIDEVAKAEKVGFDIAGS
jgi:hypothetical protein